MKPARFIFNSDYTAIRNTGHIKLSITIPNDFTAPESQGGEYYIIGVTSAALGDPNDSFTVYFESDKYNYICPGVFGYTVPEGSYSHSDYYGDTHEDINLSLTFPNNTARLEVYTLNPYPQGGLRFIGYGQTITAHILTFKDPFSA